MDFIFFRSLPTVQVMTVPSLTEFELRHRRLGHPSHHVVNLIPAVRSSSGRKKLNKACIV